MDIKKDLVEKEVKKEPRNSHPKIGFIAVYESKEASNGHNEIDNMHFTDWDCNRNQVDCDNLGAASDAYMKKRVIKKRPFGFPGKPKPKGFGYLGRSKPKGFGFPRRPPKQKGFGMKAKLGNRQVKNLANKKKGATVGHRDWKQISVHPFINFLRVFRKKFPRNAANEEIARRGRYEWRKMSCQEKQKYYEQAQRARMKGLKM